jgi:hypothetical protein
VEGELGRAVGSLYRRERALGPRCGQKLLVLARVLLVLARGLTADDVRYRRPDQPPPRPELRSTAPSDWHVRVADHLAGKFDSSGVSSANKIPGSRWMQTSGHTRRRPASAKKKSCSSGPTQRCLTRNQNAQVSGYLDHAGNDRHDVCPPAACHFRARLTVAILRFPGLAQFRPGQLPDRIGERALPLIRGVRAS